MSKIQVPAKRANFVITPEFELSAGITAELLKEGKSANILLLGPAGCGKTTWADQLAATLGLPYLHINCASIREASQLFGTREVADGKTFTRPSLFTETIEAGNAVVMLDEINRTSPMALNGLLSVLDGSSPYSDDLERHVRVAPNVVFIGACNIGSAYTGTHRLDKALDDRFARRVEVTYLPEKQEIDLLINVTNIHEEAAKRLVRIATSVRTDYNAGKVFSQDISTRVLLAAAHDFTALESIDPGSGPSSLKMTVINRFNAAGEDSERSALSMLVDGQFGSWAAGTKKK